MSQDLFSCRRAIFHIVQPIFIQQNHFSCHKAFFNVAGPFSLSQEHFLCRRAFFHVVRLFFASQSLFSYCRTIFHVVEPFLSSQDLFDLAGLFYLLDLLLCRRAFFFCLMKIRVSQRQKLYKIINKKKCLSFEWQGMMYI